MTRPLPIPVETDRRRLVLAALAGLPLLQGLPARASANPMAAMTEGPFYPPARWRAQWTDWDADLTRVAHRPDAPTARGELLGLEGDLVDTGGRRIDGAEIEIWQCDAMAVYHHPRVRMEPGRFDAGFAGFGATRSAAEGAWRFRTIRPVPYPGRTPHIHVKLRHASFGEVTSQLFVDGDPGNDGDFLWRRVDAADRPGLTMRLQPAPTGSGLRWIARHRLIVPA
jgi:protocatechuate 3,4-dioxygenase beta subunit